MVVVLYNVVFCIGCQVKSSVRQLLSDCLMLVSTFEVIFLHQLQGCLPLVLMFDVKEDIELEQGQGNFGISDLMRVAYGRISLLVSNGMFSEQTVTTAILKT